MVIRLFSGLSPFNSWLKKRLNTPIFKKGILILQKRVESGTAIGLKETEKWESKFDTTTGWFCIGDDSISKDDKNVQFLINAVATLNIGYQLKALWCKPKFRNGFNI